MSTFDNSKRFDEFGVEIHDHSTRFIVSACSKSSPIDDFIAILAHGLDPIGKHGGEQDRLGTVGRAARCLSLTVPQFQQLELRDAWLHWACGGSCGIDYVHSHDEGNDGLSRKQTNPKSIDLTNRRIPPSAEITRRRKQCLRAWQHFRPACNFDFIPSSLQSSTPRSQLPPEHFLPASLVFYAAAPSAVTSMASSASSASALSSSAAAEATSPPPPQPLQVPLAFCVVDEATGMPSLESFQETARATIDATVQVGLNRDRPPPQFRENRT